MSLEIADVFVTVAADCPADRGLSPPGRTSETLAAIQYRLLSQDPYRHTLKDLIFETHCVRSGVNAAERGARGAAIRAELFARPHPCMRASPLTKTYGWGAHYDAEGRIALFGRETAEYARFAARTDIRIDKAMRSRRGAAG